MVVRPVPFRAVWGDDVDEERAEEAESRVERKVIGGVLGDMVIVHGHRAYRWNNAVPGCGDQVLVLVNRL
jgi:hypothetical protein